MDSDGVPTLDTVIEGLYVPAARLSFTLMKTSVVVRVPAVGDSVNWSENDPPELEENSNTAEAVIVTSSETFDAETWNDCSSDTVEKQVPKADRLSVNVIAPCKVVKDTSSVKVVPSAFVANAFT